MNDVSDTSPHHLSDILLTPGQVLTLDIVDLSRGGAGMGRWRSGQVVFVPFTAPGDRVEARVTEVKKSYLQAELVNVVRASAVRVQPPCPLFGKCGGCQWQHLPYDLQFKTKVDGVRHALKRQKLDALLDPAVPWDMLPAQRVWNYRTRVQMRGVVEADRLRLGYHLPGSRQVLDVDACAIARPEINAALAELREEARNIPQRDFKVEWTVRADKTVETTWNRRHGAAGFQQAHEEQNERMQDWVHARVVDSKAGTAMTVLDLYGGSGNLTSKVLEAPVTVAKVIGVDLGCRPVRVSGAPSVERHRDDVGVWLGRQGDGAHAPGIAILDPPRAGLEREGARLIQHLKRVGIREAVLVSCAVDAFCRDIGGFLAQGWQVQRVAVIDLFPQTVHVESLAFLRYS